MRSRARPRGGVEGAAGLQPPSKSKCIKHNSFLDVVIPNVLSDLPFSKNQRLKSADEEYIKF